METATTQRTGARGIARRMINHLSTATRCGRCQAPRQAAQRFVLIDVLHAISSWVPVSQVSASDELACPGVSDGRPRRRSLCRRSSPERRSSGIITGASPSGCAGRCAFPSAMATRSAATRQRRAGTAAACVSPRGARVEHGRRGGRTSDSAEPDRTSRRNRDRSRQHLRGFLFRRSAEFRFP